LQQVLILSFVERSNTLTSEKGSKLVSPETIVACARSWLNTPYHHQASVKGAGCDCLGLIRGVWRECIGPEPERVPNYSRDWAEASGREIMLETFERNMDKIHVSQRKAGDVIVIRWKPKTVVKHCFILTERNRGIHAIDRNPVAEINLNGS